MVGDRPPQDRGGAGPHQAGRRLGDHRDSGRQEEDVEEFFAELRDRNETLLPLRTTDTFGKMQVVVKVHGGGFMGQAGAAKLAIARALVDYDPNFYVPLRQGGMLTRDAREVERKKYGQAGARRRFQFSKR